MDEVKIHPGGRGTFGNLDTPIEEMEGDYSLAPWDNPQKHKEMGHSFVVEAVVHEEPSLVEAACDVKWEEVSDKSLSGWKRDEETGEKYAQPLPPSIHGYDPFEYQATDKWYDMREYNPDASAFAEWSAYFGKAGNGYDGFRPPTASLPLNEPTKISFPDHPAVFRDHPAHDKRNIEGMVTFISGCPHCPPITVHWAQSADAKGDKNWFTHSQDTWDGPGSPSAASGRDANAGAYDTWRSSMQAKWKQGGKR